MSQEDRAAVGAAITEAEGKTSAEVVCAVATESGRYDRAEAIVGLACGLLALWGLNTATGSGAAGDGAWQEAAHVPLAWQLVAVTVGFVLGNVLASYVHPLRRLLVSDADQSSEVARSAAAVFMSKRISSTRGRGGVLLYVSLFERRVVVLADEGTFAVLGQEGVDALRDMAVAKLKVGDRRDTLVATVQAIGERLAEALPCQKDDVDELGNALLVYHPRP